MPIVMQKQGIKTPPSSGYAAPAVHFDAGSTSLHIASLTAAISSSVVFAYWIKVSGQANKTVVVVDVAGAFLNYIDFFTSGEFRSFIADATFTNDIVVRTASVPSAAWHCVLISFDASAQTVAFYDGDVAFTQDAGFPVVDGAPFTPAFNGKSLYLGEDTFGDGAAMDMADFRLWVGASIHSGATISEANRRLFIDAAGKPVDPATATAALGAPSILFSGNSTNFATNQGTGGTFTLTGSLTNASSSPSD